MGAEIKNSLHASIIGRLSLSVMTTAVMCAGIGGDSCEWVFAKEDKSLLGDQLMIQMLLVPKSVESITMSARVSATLEMFNLIPQKRRSGWRKVTLEIN